MPPTLLRCLAGLDTTEREVFDRLMLDLSLKVHAVDVFDQTIVMVTHDPVAASYADRIVFLVDGLLVDGRSNPRPSTPSTT